MANTLTKRTIIDGQRHAVIHVYVASDGSSGEISGSVVVDMSALAGNKSGGATVLPTSLKVEEIWYDINGFDARLEFGGSNPSIVAVLTGNSGSGYHDFRCFGGIPDDTTSNATGDVEIVTNGLGVTSDWGTIVIKVKKEY